MKTVTIIVTVLILAFNTNAAELEIYRGKPFAEALHDVVLSGAIAISHHLAHASPMKRVDAFRLRDGRILVLFSTSNNLGEPYSIEKLSVNSFGENQTKLESVPHLKLPSLVVPKR